MKKENVLIVHNYYQIPGGEDTVVANEKKMLEDNGHKVILYSRNNSELKTMKKLQKILLPINTIFSVRTYREIKKCIKKNNIDIVHVHNTLNLISPSVYYAALSCKVPVVQTIHNFRLLCPAATFYRDNHICEDCIKYGLKCAIRHNCYRNSKIQTLACVITLKIHRFLEVYRKINYICLTDFNKEKLLQLNNNSKQVITSSKVFVKSNFIDMNEKEFLQKQRKNQFIFVGRLDKLKGIDILLNAWTNIKNVDLVICGIGPEEEWCRSFIKENNMTNVQMMGFISNDKVIDMISESKALILPTQWYEGFPMTIIESLACGTPVIASNIGNVGDLIKDRINGLRFNFDSIEDLRKKIYEINDMYESSRNYYEEHYTKEQNYKELVSIYSSIRR